MINITDIQKFLDAENIDGWLIADFHARNHVVVEFLDLGLHLTRRSFYFIPKEGAPTALVNNIEQDRFLNLPGHKIAFSSYKMLEAELARLLTGISKIAMEYAPFGRLPTVGVVDAGTIELVRSLGVEIVSSADLVAFFMARLDEKQIATHKTAARLVNEIKDQAFEFIAGVLTSKNFVTEYQVVEYIVDLFKQNNLICDFPPSVAVDANISNPHYTPTESNSKIIKEGNLVLIDLWAKLKVPHSVYADITWMAYAGKEIPQNYASLFSLVARARDAAVAIIHQKSARSDVYGYEVDDACRRVINDAGYGKFFYHRTGHSILEAVHGPGPNIDNLEAEDRRKLLPGHLFSIEPGIYLPEFGFRSEINCLMTDHGPEVTTLPLQSQILSLLK